MKPMELANRIAAWKIEEKAIDSMLRALGPKIIYEANKKKSLREIGHECDISATYLSSVLNKKTVISPGAFVNLAKRYAEEGCVNGS